LSRTSDRVRIQSASRVNPFVMPYLIAGGNKLSFAARLSVCLSVHVFVYLILRRFTVFLKIRVGMLDCTLYRTDVSKQAQPVHCRKASAYCLSHP